MKRRFYIDFDRAIDDIKHELVKCNPKLALKQVKNRKVKIATAIAVGIVFSTGMVFDGYNMFQWVDGIIKGCGVEIYIYFL